MNKIDSLILDINKVICKNIDKFDVVDRGLLSQNILSQLRNFVEHISLKIYDNGQNIEITYLNIEKANAHVKTIGKLRFLSRFHKLLQITASHYTLDEENSERLMLKYYEYLIKIKSFLKKSYNIEVLENIGDFPIQTDSNLNEYYERIAEKLNQPEALRTKSSYNDRYYIQKIKPFIVQLEVYYEVTFTRANDYVSKFDRIIAFTKHDISPNYAVKLNLSNDSIEILDKNMPIQIIDKWEVSIRPCELNNFADIFGYHPKIGGQKETYELMRYLTATGFSLVELIDFSDKYFYYLKGKITENGKTTHFFDILEKCRVIIKAHNQGGNILRYLLYKLNNKVLKKQLNSDTCSRLSELNLEYGCIPFDEMPFNSSLKNHNPKLSDLFGCIATEEREHELFARFIKNNIEQKGNLYTPTKEVVNFENIEELISTYNDSLYYKHGHRRLEEYKNHVFIRGYEEDTYSIIEELKKISLTGFKNYSNSVNSWLQTSSYNIDCDEKIGALTQMFENSKVALIYGAAGTGKSTMINHVSNFFNDETKLFLANTNPAVDNLKRKVNAANCTFKTISKFLSYRNDETNYDILVIDECSTVSNSDMLNVLEKSSFKLLVLVGDIFQIESIFEHTENDEIILCLNYDGLYGINNINRFLQGSNKNASTEWGTHIYKIDDPVLFNETDRFTPLIYNNLKGRIEDIQVSANDITFNIEIDKVVNEFEAMEYDFELLDNAENGNSIISFSVNKYKSTDDDDISPDTVVPFQVAYAVSIHKAQGLEYNSVKIVITNEVEEMISHNIFYTAITRARENLKIYWTPETENKILTTLEKKSIGRDVSLLKSKYSL